MTESLPFEVIDRRLDSMVRRFASAIVSLGPDAAEAAIAELLGQIGEALAVDRVSLEYSPDTGPDRGALHVWLRPGVMPAFRAGVTVPLTAAGRRLCELSIDSCKEVWPYPAAFAERLQLLVSLLALAAQHGTQAQELSRTKARLERLEGSMASTVFDEESDANDFDDIIGDSQALRVAISRVQEVAPTNASVVLVGETGTGKELFARAVHDRSPRRGRQFVRVNCAALPPTLIETELFGHERGAFTGAVAMRQGRFELAHRGTLFLDEIGDLPAEVQAKLLRVLQEGEFERVGSSQTRKVDVRVVAATHHDLEASVKAGRFREDLYYRLNVYPISLPPLRERLEDIPRLVWYFVNRRQRALSRKFTRIPAGVFAALQQHSWPGNVRELENVIERAMIHSAGDTLRLDDGPSFSLANPSGGTGTLEAVERRHIEDALRRSRWRINGNGNAAEVLGLHPNTLRFRMKKLGIHRPTSPGVVRNFRRLLA